jgi:hypothetical protein
MERVIIKRAQGQFVQRGEYRVAFSGTERFVRIVCPECNCGSVLPHHIDSDGEVTPSVVCPHKTCKWHVYVTLEGWNGR